MATRNLVPRNNGEGGVGKIGKAWATGVFENLIINGQNISLNQGLSNTDTVEFASGNFVDGLTINGVDVATVTGKIDRIIDNSTEFAFFSNILSNTTAVEKTYYNTPTPEVYLSGVTVGSADDLKVYLQWDGPSDNYFGEASINGQSIPIENIQQLGEHTRRFEGYIEHLNLAGQSFISGQANNRSITIPLQELGGGPVPINISIDEIYNATPKFGQQLGESFLKEGDVVNAYIDFDTDDISSIKVHEYGLAKEIDFSSYNLENIDNFYRATIPIEVSDREGDLSIAIQATNSFGITGKLKESSDFLHNSGSRQTEQIYPNIFSTDPFSYNGRSDGLRSGENTTFSNSISNWVNGIDLINYTTLDENISIDNPQDFENFKTVNYQSGVYSDTENIQIYAHRKSNGATDTDYVTVKIANGPIIVSSLLDSTASSSESPNIIGTDEVKAGDTINAKLEINGNGTTINDISISAINQGITSGIDFSSFPGTQLVNGNFEFDVSIPVFGELGSPERDGPQTATFKVKNNFDTESDSFTTTNSIQLNNGSLPSINITSIQYPEDQQAIKYQESAIINHSASNFDTINYSSPNSQISIDNSTTYESSKNINYLTGEYNVKQDGGENNIKISATKLSNGIVTEIEDIVNIANKPLSLSIPNIPILKTYGGTAPSQDGEFNFTDLNNNDYDFSLTSDQFMLEYPNLYASSSQQDQSIVFHKMIGTGKFSNRFTITVSDLNTKGSFPWNVYAKNLAGIETTTLETGSHYTLSGFSERVIECSPTSLGAGLAEVGTTITDANNVVFENLSEGGTGTYGGTYYSFEPIEPGTSLDNSFDFDNSFVLCHSNGIVDESTKYIFNLDKSNRSANTSTSSPAQFVIKEG